MCWCNQKSHATTFGTDLQQDLFSDKTPGQLELHAELIFKPIEVSPAGIRVILGHSVKNILHEHKGVGIETILGRLSSHRARLDLEVALVVGCEFGIDLNDVFLVVGSLGDPGHGISLRIEPFVVIVVGPSLVHSTYDVVSVDALGGCLIEWDCWCVCRIPGLSLIVRVEVAVQTKILA